MTIWVLLLKVNLAFKTRLYLDTCDLSKNATEHCHVCFNFDGVRVGMLVLTM